MPLPSYSLHSTMVYYQSSVPLFPHTMLVMGIGIPGEICKMQKAIDPYRIQSRGLGLGTKANSFITHLNSTLSMHPSLKTLAPTHHPPSHNSQSLINSLAQWTPSNYLLIITMNVNSLTQCQARFQALSSCNPHVNPMR